MPPSGIRGISLSLNVHIGKSEFKLGPAFFFPENVMKTFEDATNEVYVTSGAAMLESISIKYAELVERSGLRLTPGAQKEA